MPNQEAGLENLEPAVRIEEILDGQDIEPATRLEYFLKKAAEGGGGGSGVIYFDITEEGTFPNKYLVSSKTYTELMTEISSGVLPVAKYVREGAAIPTLIFTLNLSTDTTIEFISTNIDIPPEESTDSPIISISLLAITSTNEVFLHTSTVTAET